MVHTIELTDEIYEKLRTAAAREGMTPAQWIEDTISRQIPGDMPERIEGSLLDALSPFIGVVDSSSVSPDPACRSEVGDLIDADFVRRGVTPPRGLRGRATSYD